MRTIALIAGVLVFVMANQNKLLADDADLGLITTVTEDTAQHSARDTERILLEYPPGAPAPPGEGAYSLQYSVPVTMQGNPYSFNGKSFYAITPANNIIAKFSSYVFGYIKGDVSIASVNIYTGIKDVRTFHVYFYHVGLNETLAEIVADFINDNLNKLKPNDPIDSFLQDDN